MTSATAMYLLESAAWVLFLMIVGGLIGGAVMQARKDR